MILKETETSVADEDDLDELDEDELEDDDFE
jgi:hypothetical protein